MKYKKQIILVFVFALGFLAFSNRDAIDSLLKTIELYSENTPILAALMVILTQAVFTSLAFPGLPVTLFIGGLFGPLWGTVVAVIGNTIGSAVAFLLSRYLLRDYVSNKVMSKYPKMKEYEERLKQNGFTTVLVLRLIPLFPYNATNFLLGVTKLKFKDYALASFIGMIPGTFLFVGLGGSIRDLDPMTIALNIAGIILLIYFGRKYEKKVQNKKVNIKTK
jgi:uncharacterized membrane protein YdjX (TVP38/TMEM64 family)